MAKITHTNPETFEDSEIEYDDELIRVAEHLSTKTDIDGYICQPVITTENEKTLIFGIWSSDRKPGEKIKNKFRITIEKLD